VSVKPKRGDVYWVDYDWARGSEQRGLRPSLIVQNDRGNKSARTTVVAIISSAPLPQKFPFTVPLSAGEAQLPRAGHVNCAHLHTVDLSRLGDYIGALSTERMQQVAEALHYELAIS